MGKQPPGSGAAAVEKPLFDPRLSQISTQWTLVFQSHGGGSPELVEAAQVALVDRYSAAIHRYVLGAVRDPEVAKDLVQEFLVRFLRGDFHRADPSRGRFRDFVKRSLRNLMLNHFKAQKRAPRTIEGTPEPASPGDDFDTEFDRQFVQSWRTGILDRAWDGLKLLQQHSGQPYYQVLRCRVEHPDMRSPDLAAELSKQLGRTVTAGGVRQALLRSREKFVGLLFEEVSASISNPTLDEIEEELIDLGLIEYCRPLLAKKRETSRERKR